MSPRLAPQHVGWVAAIAAHTMWGLFPLYWGLLAAVPPLELACHRMVWAFLVLCVVVPGLIAVGRELPLRTLLRKLASRRVIGLYLVAAIMLGINWLAFVWAVSNGKVLQASLGYYINPLLSILLGVLVLKERLMLSQWLAAGIAAVGVTVMTMAEGEIPWASLAMASAFATYGLVKKKTPLSSLPGLWVEVTLLVGPALLAVGPLASPAVPPFTLSIWLLLMGGGVITVLPLSLFAVSARRLPLSTVGVLQYIGPTLQFLVAVVVNGEAFGLHRLLGFICVWIGSALYLLGLRRRVLAARNERANREASMRGDGEQEDGERPASGSVKHPGKGRNVPLGANVE